MTITGIIAEYNPFHIGHAYHLNKARELTRADYLVVVMSGDFVQRGEPAIIDKYYRTQMALECGADLVLELPVIYSTAGGEDFANGAVALLHHLGTINTICFGSESGQIDPILSAAKFLDHLSPKTEQCIRDHLKSGRSYPAAVAEAIRSTEYIDTEYSQLISSPNNMLGIEYCRALSRLSSAIKPMTIRRQGSYHDAFTDISSAPFASASALRSCFSKNSGTDGLDQIRPYVPPIVTNLLQNACGHSFPMTADDFTDALLLRLLEHSHDSLSGISDMSNDLAARVLKALPSAHSFTNLAEAIKCKSYTRLRINRALLHTLLGITDRLANEAKSTGYTHYGRILGYREKAKPLLSELYRASSVPLICQPAQDNINLSEIGKQFFALDTFAAELYRLTAQRKFGHPLTEEYRQKLLIC